MTVPHAPARSAVVDNFSLVRGSLYHLQKRLKLAGSDRKRVLTRVLIAVAITWLPLFFLSLMEGTLLSHEVRVPFLRDFATNIRLLITLPVLICAQLIIDGPINKAVRQFVDSGLVTVDMLPSYEAVVTRTARLRDSPVMTVILFALAFAPSMFLRNAEIVASGTSTWQGHLAQSGISGHSTAGYYNLIVSFPIYRLIFFRWIYLILVWAIFLWRATRLPLHCTPCHPDGAGGLRFIGHAQVFFGPIALAASAVAAGGLANLIAYEGGSVDSLKYEMMGLCLLGIVVTAAPLLVVTPTLFALKEQGLLDYHTLGVEYTTDFDRKWIRNKGNTGGEAEREPLLGTADIQSLADLNGSVSIVQDMRIVLVDREVLVGLGVPVILPMIVLLAAVTPVEKVLGTLSHLLF
jgi:hypothetical protein